MFVSFEAFGYGFGQGHCVRRFSGHTDMIKINGMKKLVLQSNDDDGIPGDFLVNGDVDAEEKAHQNQADDDYRYEFAFLPHPQRIPSKVKGVYALFQILSFLQFFWDKVKQTEHFQGKKGSGPYQDSLSSSAFGRGILKKSIFSVFNVSSSFFVAEPLMLLFSVTP